MHIWVRLQRSTWEQTDYSHHCFSESHNHFWGPTNSLTSPMFWKDNFFWHNNASHYLISTKHAKPPPTLWTQVKLFFNQLSIRSKSIHFNLNCLPINISFAFVVSGSIQISLTLIPSYDQLFLSTCYLFDCLFPERQQTGTTMKGTFFYLIILQWFLNRTWKKSLLVINLRTLFVYEKKIRMLTMYGEKNSIFYWPMNFVLIMSWLLTVK